MRDHKTRSKRLAAKKAAPASLAGVLDLRVCRLMGPIPEVENCSERRQSRFADCSNALYELRDPLARRQQSGRPGWRRGIRRTGRLRMSCFETNCSAARKKAVPEGAGKGGDGCHSWHKTDF